VKPPIKTRPETEDFEGLELLYGWLVKFGSEQDALDCRKRLQLAWEIVDRK
jgi:hypothetical protein